MTTWNVSGMQRDSANQRGHKLIGLLGRYFLVVAFILLVIGFSILRPDSFLTANNFSGLFVNQIVVVFAAVGLMAPLIVGELDLSVGYLVGFGQALVVALMTIAGFPVVAAVATTLVACALLGLVNGILVVRFEINSLIATLAVGNILYGIVLWFTGGTILFQDVPQDFLAISGRSFISVPLPIWYGIVLVAVVEFVLNYLPIGRRFYAIGGNRRAAMLTGIPVPRLVLVAFAASAVTCGLGGIIIASRLGSAQPELGPSFLMPAFASAFLGATTISPGRYNALGTAAAVYVVAVIVAGLQQLGVPFWAENIVYGLALVSGVGLSRRLIRMREQQARQDQLRALKESRADAL
jgi:ribose transport system permease protein